MSEETSTPVQLNISLKFLAPMIGIKIQISSSSLLEVSPEEHLIQRLEVSVRISFFFILKTRRGASVDMIYNA